jgi:hypothetical protein
VSSELSGWGRSSTSTAFRSRPTCTRFASAKQGSFSVTMDSLGTGSPGPNGVVAYAEPHGSATAVLPAASETSATGTVNLTAQF